MNTLTREEANRARELAVERRHSANANLNSWARIIAEDAVRYAGSDRVTAADASGDRLIVARAEAFEALADWQEARERWQAASR